MTGNNSNYQFSPRPEAKAMNWEDLQPPVQNAVRQLLVLIAGAKRISEKKQNVEQEPNIDSKETANCFLLHGARGQGKTTVLLSARKAIFKKNDFFPKKVWNKGSESTEDSETKKEPETSEADKAYEYVIKDNLEHIAWLDLLDMEPLPADANLLATVLTRVRNALETCDGVNRNSALTSIFEEDTKSARHLLSGLIRDATMMWEDIKETDTRESANRQITTADIYASFRERFIKAIDELSKELGRPYGHNVLVPIILPLDNIDRSTEHLKSIVKLAELVSHPYLWLIMAGGREEISTYLERAYWKELISTHVGVGPLGRTDSKGEDETLAMARRQAAAAAQKLWPSNHRIKLKRVEPKVALAFKPKNEEISLEDLFKQIDIPNWLDKPANQTSKDQKQKKKGKSQKQETENIKLIDLFRFRGIEGAPLTRAAQLALRLPVRSLLDLWQITYWVWKDDLTFPVDYRKAEKITRTMLRNTLSESMVPNKISKTLHEHVIRYEPDKGTLLNFKELEFKVDCHAPYDTSRRLYSTSKQGMIAGSPIKSFIDVRHSENGFQIFKLKDAQNSHKDEEYYEELPINVAGWLVILYDILALSDKLGVINRAIIDPPVIGTTHGIAIEQEGKKRYVQQHLKWPMPKWVTFRAYDIFSQCWKVFQKGYEGKSEVLAKQQGGKSEMHEENPMALQSRYLAAGWVSCVLYTFEALTRQDIEFISGESLSEDSIKNFENKVMEKASQLYSGINAEISKSYDYFDQDIMCHWLENELPLLMSYWYVPTSDSIPKKDKKCRLQTAVEYLKNLKVSSEGKKLAESWEENLPFIVAAMDDNLESLFREEAANKPDKEYGRSLKKLDREYQLFLDKLKELCALHNWLTATSGMEITSDAS